MAIRAFRRLIPLVRPSMRRSVDLVSLVVKLMTVGILSKIITTLESHPPEPVITPHNPLMGYLTCMADHAPEFPKDLAKQVRNPKRWKKLAKELAGGDRRMNSYLATTQAVDLINGGVKVNALPEVVEGTCTPLGSPAQLGGMKYSG